VPILHMMHVEFDSAPSAVEKVPATQVEHKLEPVIAEKSPAEHKKQLVELFDAVYFPLSHRSQEIAPSIVENVPAMQLEQLFCPSVLLYVPSLHGRQVVLFAPKKPALQEQFFGLKLPWTDHELTLQFEHVVAAKSFPYVPGGQERQTELLEPPVVIEYLPAKHAKHTLAPRTSEYMPAEQFMHSVILIEDLNFPALQGTG